MFNQAEEADNTKQLNISNIDVEQSAVVFDPNQSQLDAFNDKNEEQSENQNAK